MTTLTFDAAAHAVNLRTYVAYNSRSGRATEAAVNKAGRSFPLFAAGTLARMLMERGLPVSHTTGRVVAGQMEAR